MSPFDQGTQKLDVTSTRRLQKRVRELANAAQAPFADCALHNYQNQFPTESNNEAKVCKSTKSVVLRKARVMNFGDIGEERVERAAKDTIRRNKKRGRERKIIELQPEIEVASSTKEVKNSKGARIHGCRSTAAGAPEARSEPQPGPQLEPAPWKAPVARMY